MSDLDTGAPTAGTGTGRLLTLTDQALSSGTNFIISIAAAGALSPRSLGVFAVAFATYLIALGVVRAACGEALLVRHAGSPAHRWQGLTRASTGLAAAMAGAASGFAASVFFGGPRATAGPVAAKAARSPMRARRRLNEANDIGSEGVRHPCSE